MGNRNFKTEALLLVAGIGVVILMVAFFSGRGETDEELLALQNNAMPNTYTEAVLKTNMGDITVTLFSDKAPETVANFIRLSEQNFYDGTKFHRVIRDFMIQGGDPGSKGDDRSIYGIGGPGYMFKDEINDIKLEKGIMAMANSGPNTNGSQFFIITAAQTPWLQGKHTQFGKVTSGMNVVDRIGAVRTDARDVPIEPVVLESIILK
jgi:cyclophilin family peptidyl-prolyl cis-trans isomerase